MIIIVEGVNASGKSSLTRVLSAIYDMKIVHAGPKPITDEIAIVNCEEQFQLDNVILDRATCISRPVYGDNNENYYSFSENHKKSLDWYLRQMAKKSVFIHTTGKGKHELKDYYTPFHIEQITKNREVLAGRYKEIFKKVDHFEYNFDVDDLRKLLEYIDNKERELCQQC